LDNVPSLVAEARSGSHEAFCRLLRITQGRVRAYLGRYVRNLEIVDDLAQETFLSAYRSLDRYSGEFPFVLWLLGIARNRALTYLRDEAARRSRESRTLSSRLLEWRSQVLSLEGAKVPDCDRELAALESCVKRLPKHSAQLIDAHYFRNQSAAHIARGTNQKESTLRVTLLRIRQALRHCVQSQIAGSTS